MLEMLPMLSRVHGYIQRERVKSLDTRRARQQRQQSGNRRATGDRSANQEDGGLAMLRRRGS